MNKDQFIELLSGVLETDQRIDPEMKLVDLDGYDSLRLLGLVAMIHSTYGVQLTAADFANIDTTVQSLIDTIEGS